MAIWAKSYVVYCIVYKRFKSSLVGFDITLLSWSPLRKQKWTFKVHCFHSFFCGLLKSHFYKWSVLYEKVLRPFLIIPKNCLDESHFNNFVGIPQYSSIGFKYFQASPMSIQNVEDKDNIHHLTSGVIMIFLMLASDC